MFQVCKYDLKFKNCFVPLKWVRNKLDVSSIHEGLGGWLCFGLGEGRGQGFLSSSHLNTAGFPGAGLIPLAYELLNAEPAHRAEAMSFCKAHRLICTGLDHGQHPVTGCKRSLLFRRDSPVCNPD